MKIEKRIDWVDNVKAFACFLVVLGHLLQSLQISKIDLHPSITTFIIWFIYLFHMPLFMCMSGYLYLKNKKNFSWKEYKKFEFKKFVNLIVPYVTFYLLFVLINIIFSKSVNKARGIDDLLKMFNNPIAPYWFLYALLSIFLIVPLLEKILKNDKKKIIIIFVILKFVSTFIKTNIYFIDAIMSYSIYFYLSSIIIDISNLNNNKTMILIYIYIGTSIIFYKFQYNISIYSIEIIKTFFAILGIYICINFFKNTKRITVFNTFKKYTFQIYLLHTIFAAGIRISLIKVGIKNYTIHFLMGIIVSIYMPVIISIISNKIKYTNFFFYPIKTIKEIIGRS